MEGQEKESSEKKKKSVCNTLTFLLQLLLIVSLFATLLNFHLSFQNISYEVGILKLEVRLLKRQLYANEAFLNRRKRQIIEGDINTAKKSGVNVLDYPYGASYQSESQLSVYPTLMGELKDYDDASFSNNHDSSQSQRYGDQNQLGIHRQQSNFDNEQKIQSAYSRRVNAHRSSRVASTPDFAPSTTTSSTTTPKPIPISMLKSLDSSSRTFDSVAEPILSVHLQARQSIDESSADLTTGVHNSWRFSAWSKKLHGASLFTLNEEDGKIEVPENGLYLVYAQVEYLDINEINGFEIDFDDEATLSCVTSTSGSDEEKKHNTCHTLGVVYLQKGSLLGIRDKEVGRYSLLHSKGTFFGLTKLQ